jgi:hypothetical protein
MLFTKKSLVNGKISDRNKSTQKAVLDLRYSLLLMLELLKCDAG